MASISSPGLGSGLDVNGIVSQLMALERRPLEQLQRATTRNEAQLSAFGKLQASMSALRDAARKLTESTAWTPTTVATTNAAAVSATSDGKAPPGTYAIEVSRLAAAQTVSTNATFSGADGVVGSGRLTIELGTWSVDGNGQNVLTGKPGTTPVTVNITSGANTLAEVRDAINAAGAGVTASIVSDANGSRLAIRSTETGQTNGFRISVTDDDFDNGDAGGLSRLAFDPSTGVSQSTQTLAAGNAQATINGVAVESETNTLNDVLDGLTVRLGQVTTAAVDLTVERDTKTIKTSITDFARAYNDLVKLVREQTRYDDSTKSAGVLQADRSAVGLLSQLRTLVGGNSGATAAFTRLADVGLEPQADGTLKVSDSKLDAAIGNKLTDLEQFFKRDDTGTANDGFGALLRSFSDGALGTDGVLTTRQEGLKERIANAADSADRIEQRLALVEKRLRDQYTKLDTNVARLSALQDYVSQQIKNWNRSSE